MSPAAERITLTVAPFGRGRRVSCEWGDQREGGQRDDPADGFPGAVGGGGAGRRGGRLLPGRQRRPSRPGVRPDGDLLQGGSGNDQIKAFGGDDTVRGEAGDDTLLGYGGDDTLIGGPGKDLARGHGGNDVCPGAEAFGNCTP